MDLWRIRTSTLKVKSKVAKAEWFLFDTDEHMVTPIESEEDTMAMLAA